MVNHAFKRGRMGMGMGMRGYGHGHFNSQWVSPSPFHYTTYIYQPYLEERDRALPPSSTLSLTSHTRSQCENFSLEYKNQHIHSHFRFFMFSLSFYLFICRCMHHAHRLFHTALVTVWSHVNTPRSKTTNNIGINYCITLAFINFLMNRIQSDRLDFCRAEYSGAQ